jgi:hypothetical protein
VRLILREVGVPLRTWLAGVVLPNLPGAGVQAALCALLVPVASASDSLLVTALLAGVTVAASFAAFVGLGMGRAERAELRTTVAQAMGQRDGRPLDAEEPSVDPAGARAADEMLELP